MKPNSIKLFDYFYLGSIFLGFLGFATGYFSAGAPVSYVIAYFVGEVIRLVLWYLLSRRRSIIAKWIIVALFLLSLISVGGCRQAGRRKHRHRHQHQHQRLHSRRRPHPRYRSPRLA